MKAYSITEEDFNRCIGGWLNADNPKFQEYVQGIKLFKEYLDDLQEADTKVITTASTDPDIDTTGSQDVNDTEV